MTCDMFKTRCKLKKLMREKAIVEHLHLVYLHINTVAPSVIRVNSGREGGGGFEFPPLHSLL